MDSGGDHVTPNDAIMGHIKTENAPPVDNIPPPTESQLLSFNIFGRPSGPNDSTETTPQQFTDINFSSSGLPKPDGLMLHTIHREFDSSSQYSISSTENHNDSSSSISSPASVHQESLSSPGNGFPDTQQSTLVRKTGGLRLYPDNTASDMYPDSTDDLWSTLNDNAVMPEARKALRIAEDSDAPSSSVEHAQETEGFDAAGAKLTSEYNFTKISDSENSVFKFGSSGYDTQHPTLPTTMTRVPKQKVIPSDKPPTLSDTPKKRSGLSGLSSTRSSGSLKKTKEPLLCQQFPSSADGIELLIVNEPEEQHRARYRTEGSRGAVKDRSGNSHPIVKMIGYNHTAVLQVFVATDCGKVKPHGFYQVCKVCGKNSSPCMEKIIEGTSVIEIELNPDNDMTARIDCVGILKLRNVDVERRFGNMKTRKKSVKTRLAYRACILNSDGAPQIIQIASAPILCTQPIGLPEIGKISHQQGSVNGGQELFIIGKNFMKANTCKVLFQEMDALDQIVWEEEARVDKDFFQSTHLICTVPKYRTTDITEPVRVSVIIHCGAKTSEPCETSIYTYMPVGMGRHSIDITEKPSPSFSQLEALNLPPGIYDNPPDETFGYASGSASNVASSLDSLESETYETVIANPAVSEKYSTLSKLLFDENPQSDCDDLSDEKPDLVSEISRHNQSKTESVDLGYCDDSLKRKASDDLSDGPLELSPEQSMVVDDIKYIQQDSALAAFAKALKNSEIQQSNKRSFSDMENSSAAHYSYEIGQNLKLSSTSPLTDKSRSASCTSDTREPPIMPVTNSEMTSVVQGQGQPSRFSVTTVTTDSCTLKMETDPTGIYTPNVISQTTHQSRGHSRASSGSVHPCPPEMPTLVPISPVNISPETSILQSMLNDASQSNVINTQMFNQPEVSNPQLFKQPEIPNASVDSTGQSLPRSILQSNIIIASSENAMPSQHIQEYPTHLVSQSHQVYSSQSQIDYNYITSQMQSSSAYTSQPTPITTVASTIQSPNVIYSLHSQIPVTSFEQSSTIHYPAQSQSISTHPDMTHDDISSIPVRNDPPPYVKPSDSHMLHESSSMTTRKDPPPYAQPTDSHIHQIVLPNPPYNIYGNHQPVPTTIQSMNDHSSFPQEYPPTSHHVTDAPVPKTDDAYYAQPTPVSQMSSFKLTESKLPDITGFSQTSVSNIVDNKPTGLIINQFVPKSETDMIHNQRINDSSANTVYQPPNSQVGIQSFLSGTELQAELHKHLVAVLHQPDAKHYSSDQTVIYQQVQANNTVVTDNINQPHMMSSLANSGQSTNTMVAKDEPLSHDLTDITPTIQLASNAHYQPEVNQATMLSYPVNTSSIHPELPNLKIQEHEMSPQRNRNSTVGVISPVQSLTSPLGEQMDVTMTPVDSVESTHSEVTSPREKQQAVFNTSMGNVYASSQVNPSLYQQAYTNSEASQPAYSQPFTQAVENVSALQSPPFQNTLPQLNTFHGTSPQADAFQTSTPLKNAFPNESPQQAIVDANIPQTAYQNPQTQIPTETSMYQSVQQNTYQNVADQQTVYQNQSPQNVTFSNPSENPQKQNTFPSSQNFQNPPSQTVSMNPSPQADSYPNSSPQSANIQNQSPQNTNFQIQSPQNTFQNSSPQNAFQNTPPQNFQNPSPNSVSYQNVAPQISAYESPPQSVGFQNASATNTFSNKLPAHSTYQTPLQQSNFQNVSQQQTYKNNSPQQNSNQSPQSYQQPSPQGQIDNSPQTYVDTSQPSMVRSRSQSFTDNSIQQSQQHVPPNIVDTQKVEPMSNVKDVTHEVVDFSTMTNFHNLEHNLYPRDAMLSSSSSTTQFDQSKTTMDVNESNALDRSKLVTPFTPALINGTNDSSFPPLDNTLKPNESLSYPLISSAKAELPMEISQPVSQQVYQQIPTQTSQPIPGSAFYPISRQSSDSSQHMVQQDTSDKAKVEQILNNLLSGYNSPQLEAQQSSAITQPSSAITSPREVTPQSQPFPPVSQQTFNQSIQQNVSTNMNTSQSEYVITRQPISQSIPTDIQMSTNIQMGSHSEYVMPQQQSADVMIQHPQQTFSNVSNPQSNIQMTSPPENTTTQQQMYQNLPTAQQSNVSTNRQEPQLDQNMFTNVVKSPTNTQTSNAQMSHQQYQSMPIGQEGIGKPPESGGILQQLLEGQKESEKCHMDRSRSGSFHRSADPPVQVDISLQLAQQQLQQAQRQLEEHEKLSHVHEMQIEHHKKQIQQQADQLQLAQQKHSESLQQAEQLVQQAQQTLILHQHLKQQQKQLHSDVSQQITAEQYTHQQQISQEPHHSDSIQTINSDQYPKQQLLQQHQPIMSEPVQQISSEQYAQQQQMLKQTHQADNTQQMNTDQYTKPQLLHQSEVSKPITPEQYNHQLLQQSHQPADGTPYLNTDQYPKQQLLQQTHRQAESTQQVNADQYTKNQNILHQSEAAKQITNEQYAHKQLLQQHSSDVSQQMSPEQFALQQQLVQHQTENTQQVNADQYTKQQLSQHQPDASQQLSPELYIQQRQMLKQVDNAQQLNTTDQYTKTQLLQQNPNRTEPLNQLSPEQYSHQQLLQHSDNSPQLTDQYVKQQLLKHQAEMSQQVNPEQFSHQQLLEAAKQQLLQHQQAEAAKQQLLQQQAEAAKQQLLQKQAEAAKQQLLQQQAEAAKQQLLQQQVEAAKQQLLQQQAEATKQHLLQQQQQSEPSQQVTDQMLHQQIQQSVSSQQASPEQYGHTQQVSPEQYGHSQQVSHEQYGHSQQVSPEQYGHTQQVSPEQYGHSQQVNPEQYGHSQQVSPEQYGHTQQIIHQSDSSQQITDQFTQQQQQLLQQRVQGDAQSMSNEQFTQQQLLQHLSHSQQQHQQQPDNPPY